MGKFKKRILIDLDGVLNTYQGDYNPEYIPPLADGAIEFLEKLYTDYELVLFSARNIDSVKEWCLENKLNKYFSDITNIKKSSYLIIDDRCICFNGCFNQLLSQIKEFKPYNKQSSMA